jgi:hypothetical protein
MGENKMKKYTVSALIALLLALTAFAPLAAQTAFDFETKPDDGGVVITGSAGPGGAVTIPAAINSKSVTRIGDYAFFNCAGLTSVTIPDSVTSIGAGAFAVCGIKPEVRVDIRKRFGHIVF